MGLCATHSWSNVHEQLSKQSIDLLSFRVGWLCCLASQIFLEYTNSKYLYESIFFVKDSRIFYYVYKEKEHKCIHLF